MSFQSHIYNRLSRYWRRTQWHLKSSFPPTLEEPLRRTLSRIYFEEVQIEHPEFKLSMVGEPPEKMRLSNLEQIGCHEPTVTRELVRFLENRPRAVFWDIGSRYGYYSRLATSLVDDPAQIHVFEPVRRNLTFIRANNQKYADGRIHVNQKALGDDIDQTTTRADKYYQRHGCPDLVKIDVDGPEDTVLQGMVEMLSDCSPMLFLEMHFLEGYDARREAVQQVLRESNYDCQICLNHREFDSEWSEVTLDDLPTDPSLIPDSAERQIDYMLKCVPSQSAKTAGIRS